MKAVLFATGPSEQAAAEAAALRQRLGADAVRVVAAPGEKAAFLHAASALPSSADIPVLEAGPLVIFKIWMAIGVASTEVLCLSHQQANGKAYRFLKLLAYAVRGRVVFVRPDGRAPLGLWAFLSVTLSRFWGRENGALLVGSASPATLRRLEADLRQRRPGSAVHVLENPSLLDFLRVARNWRLYCYVSIPWTGEGHNGLKLFAWLLPCGRREIYNEAGDSFSVRLTGTLLAHIGRRLRERMVAIWNGIRYVCWWTGDKLLAAWNGVCYAAWRARDMLLAAWNGICYAAWRIRDTLLAGWHRVRYACWWTGDALLAGWYKLVAIPPGVTVIGSASGYYLKGIVADLRRKNPGAPIYGILPAKLIAPAGPLFDAVIPMRPLAILFHALGRHRTGWCAIPCTNEGYNRYKFLVWLFPLGHRKVYNENGDGYAIRNWRMLVKHGFWRLKHRLFYQAFTQRRGRSWPVLAMHLVLYPFRLAAGAALLMMVRLRAKRRPAIIPTRTDPDLHVPTLDAPTFNAAANAAVANRRVLDPAER
jgi:hypothetical protein